MFYRVDSNQFRHEIGHEYFWETVDIPYILGTFNIKHPSRIPISLGYRKRSQEYLNLKTT